MSALIASLFAVGAAPAAALDEDSMPNATAATSACVGDAMSDMMFSDVSEMHAFRADINCLAYYGVTIGYGDGTFRPENDVSRGEMVLFMERAAGIAGADAEAVVGDFAMSGSDPVHRGDMALLIARLLASATSGESPVNVTNNADGTFAVSGVSGDAWDYFADSRRSQNRVHDSAASALYELGVAKGTGMGYFSPAASVSRGQMAAFITRALAHTSARPAGVSIQSDEPGGVIISVRDANFQPLANEPVDVFSARADQVDEAFSDDGSCYMPRVDAVGGNAKLCEIDALDAPTGLSGDYDPGTINVAAGGTTVWAWTGDYGDKVEDGGEGLAQVSLTAATPVTANSAKVTTDIPDGATRVHFGSTVTVTIQLVGANDADAVRDSGGNSYTVTIRRASGDTNIRGNAAPANVTDATAASKETRTLNVDASGKATFTITASDPDATDRNNPVGADEDTSTSPVTPAVPDKIDRVRVTYTVEVANGGQAVDDAISETETLEGNAGSQTITFSDARGVLDRASIKPTADFLTRPMSGSARNTVTVTVVDQYGGGIRGHLVRLSSTHAPASVSAATSTSMFPVARETDSSGSVRIGYAYTGPGSVETITANTAADKTAGAALTPITVGAGGSNVTEEIYWAAPAAGPDVASGAVLAFDLERNTIIVANASNGPQMVLYDDNDQYAIGPSGSEVPRSMAAFEEAITDDADDPADNKDAVVVSSYNPADSSDVARFVLTVN